MNKKLIRLTESDLHRIVTESVNKVLNELDPRTYANYARGREAQMNKAIENGDKEAEFKYWQKRNAGEQAAKDKWNEWYGHSSENGRDYNSQWMDNTHGENFSNNFGSKYGINYKSSDIGFDGKRRYNNYAYNPKTNMEWHGYGANGPESYTNEYIPNTGDNGAHRVAREMELGNGNYVKGKGWQ